MPLDVITSYSIHYTKLYDSNTDSKPELHTDASLFSWINRFFAADKNDSPLSSIDIAFYPFTNDDGDKIRKEITRGIEKLLGFSA